MRRLILCLAASLALHGAPPRTFADGKVFPTASAIPPVIPDQQALISWHDGVETLVIRNRLIASGERFAWIVPVPAPAEVTAVTPGLMPTLEALFQPRVRHWVPNPIPTMLFLTVFSVLLLYKRPVAYAFFVVGVLFASIFIPSLGRARALGDSPDPPSEVTIHQRVTIDGYEVASIGSDDPNALIKWLEENDFAVDQASRPVIAAYVKDGWQFAAVRLAGVKADQVPAQAPALAFTFSADRAVYPLRLTGTQGTPINLELYIFGPQQATTASARLGTRSCRATAFPPTPEEWPLGWTEPRQVPIVHPALRQLTDGTAVATHLAGRLQAADMVEDARIEWQPYAPKEYVVESRALVARVTWTAWWAAACWAAFRAAWKMRIRRVPTPAALRQAGAVMAAATLILWPLSLAWPTVDVRESQGSESSNASIHRMLAELGVPPTTTLDQIPAAIGASQETYRGIRRSGPINCFTGGPPIHEDSPGNWDVRPVGSGFEYLWYDGHGGEHALPLMMD